MSNTKIDVEQGLIITNNTPGCTLSVYATGIDSFGTLSPIRAKIASLDFDKLIEGYPDALFYTVIVEKSDK